MHVDSDDPRLIRQRYEIGDRFRSLRRWRNLTQEGLGHSIGADRTTIVRIEAGRDSFLVDQALKAAIVLAIPVAWFFTDDWTWPDWHSEGDGETPPDRARKRHG